MRHAASYYTVVYKAVKILPHLAYFRVDISLNPPPQRKPTHAKSEVKLNDFVFH